jgi:hypothetical protein
MTVLRLHPEPQIDSALFSEPSVAGLIARTAFFGAAGGGAVLVASGALPLSVAASAEAPAKASVAGSVPLGGTATGAAPAKAASAGSLPLTGGATGQAPARANGAGALPVSGSGSAEAPARASGAGQVALGGEAEGRALAAAVADGVLDLTGLAVAILPPLVDYSTGRLIFATVAPRRGTILTVNRRTGRILIPVRRGRILELTE